MKFSVLRKLIFPLLFFVLLFSFVNIPHVFAADNRVCTQQTVTVNLSASDPTPYHVVGWLCSNGSLENKTVQLIVPGATYSHIYSDFPFSSPYYSYTQAANNAGFATFNIDKLGTGLSDHPIPELITIPALAYNTHQIVQALKAGQIGGVAFKKVILVGHSMGSETIIEEAGNYQDVDGVLVTGHIHNSNPLALPLIQSALSPAAFDPQFASQNLPLGYLTTKPGTRAQLFYYAPGADPAVINKDEQTKDLLTDGMATTFFSLLLTHTSNNIHVPVMTIIGQKDFIYCPNGECTLSFVKTNEAQYYSSDTCTQFAVIPGTGHDLALHYSAPLTDAAVLAWASLRVGIDASKPAPSPCN